MKNKIKEILNKYIIKIDDESYIVYKDSLIEKLERLLQEEYTNGYGMGMNAEQSVEDLACDRKKYDLEEGDTYINQDINGCRKRKNVSRNTTKY